VDAGIYKAKSYHYSKALNIYNLEQTVQERLAKFDRAVTFR